ncbi:MAG: YjbF family lipoprotein [Rhodoferax sp.]|nr:YjbF family lipoprotein [Rhodoferax sp.]
MFIKQLFFCILRLLSVFLLLFLSACASDSLLSSVAGAVYREHFGATTDASVTAPLNPAYRYLRASLADNQTALLVLGYVDSQPQGDIEVWYSAQKEIIKIQNGRIVATAGLPMDWLRVDFAVPPPIWGVVNGLPTSYTRVRDEMAGYRYGVTENLALEAVVGPPANVLTKTLPLELAQAYVWYVETTQDRGSRALPPSWYAVATVGGSQAVVYSYQCLSPQVCLSLQRWPPVKAPS